VIRSFGDRHSEKVWSGEYSKKFPREIQPGARERMVILNEARKLEDLYFPPSNGFHALSGKLSGFYALRINRQWRVIFAWENGDAEQVKISDYH
jgi:proteic killer suppression protein